MEELDAIRARAEGATEGPWEGDGFQDYDVYNNRRIIDLSIYPISNQFRPVASSINNESDAVFIAHARTDIPKLLAALHAIQVECKAEEDDNDTLNLTMVSTYRIRQLITEALA